MNYLYEKDYNYTSGNNLFKWVTQKANSASNVTRETKFPFTLFGLGMIVTTWFFGFRTGDEKFSSLRSISFMVLRVCIVAKFELGHKWVQIEFEELRDHAILKSRNKIPEFEHVPSQFGYTVWM